MSDTLSDPGAGVEAPDAATVLIVDDERSNVLSLKKIFEREGMRVLTAQSAKEALETVRSHRIEVVLTDLMMPGTSGLELLRAIRQLSPDIEVVMMTAYGTVQTAVQAMRQGAYDFIEKPLKRMTIVKAVRKAAERRSLVAENRSLRQQIKNLKERRIVGSSAALRQVLDVAAQAAPSRATVLVLGESGTGKELIARYIHEHSGREAGRFVGVNCAAIPESILETELFGHERGAFTGASERRDGRFVKAHGGTLFLDEVGEMSPAVQVKLLRALQEGEIEPVGGDTRQVDVRVIAATNKDLQQEVAAGRFREDLFYRLNVIAITAPALRSRREDVPLLVDHFLAEYCRRNGRARLSVPAELMRRLVDAPWPGNVRQLENAIERAVVLCPGDTIRREDLPADLQHEENLPTSMTISVGTPLEEVEQRLMRATLQYTRGDKNLAAQMLGISTRTVYRKLSDETE